MTESLTGGCACGAIRFECSHRPLMMFLCHCRDCQRASGSGSVPVTVFAAGSVTITQGEPVYYSTPNLRGAQNKRAFCGRCGSRLFGAMSDRIIGVTASSFDNSSWFTPAHHIFISQAQDWDCMDAQLPMHETYKPS